GRRTFLAPVNSPLASVVHVPVATEFPPEPGAPVRRASCPPALAGQPVPETVIVRAAVSPAESTLVLSGVRVAVPPPPGVDSTLADHSESAMVPVESWALRSEE